MLTNYTTRAVRSHREGLNLRSPAYGAGALPLSYGGLFHSQSDTLASVGVRHLSKLQPSHHRATDALENLGLLLAR